MSYETKELEKQLRTLASKFNFWFTEYIDNKHDECMLGLPKEGIQVFISMFYGHTFTLQISNGLWESNPKHLHIEMPILSISDLILPLKIVKMYDVVEYINGMNTNQ